MRSELPGSPQAVRPWRTRVTRPTGRRVLDAPSDVLLVRQVVTPEREVPALVLGEDPDRCIEQAVAPLPVDRVVIGGEKYLVLPCVVCGPVKGSQREFAAVVEPDLCSELGRVVEAVAFGVDR